MWRPVGEEKIRGWEAVAAIAVFAVIGGGTAVRAEPGRSGSAGW